MRLSWSISNIIFVLLIGHDLVSAGVRPFGYQANQPSRVTSILQMGYCVVSCVVNNLAGECQEMRRCVFACFTSQPDPDSGGGQSQSARKQRGKREAQVMTIDIDPEDPNMNPYSWADKDYWPYQTKLDKGKTYKIDTYNERGQLIDKDGQPVPGQFDPEYSNTFEQQGVRGQGQGFGGWGQGPRQGRQRQNLQMPNGFSQAFQCIGRCFRDNIVDGLMGLSKFIWCSVSTCFCRFSFP